MIKISEFYGISIYMDFHKNIEIPFICAEYKENSALFSLETEEVIDGYFKPRGIEFVKEWIQKNREVLMGCWNKKKAYNINPLW